LNLVIDASVLIKFFVPEVLADRAVFLLDSSAEEDSSLMAPDLIYSESGNILWKKHRLKELTRSEVDKITDAIILLPIRTENSKTLLPLALGMAMTYGVTVYDAMYMSLARIYGTQMVTADRKLFEKVAGTDMKKHVSWLGHLGE
jgi:predicted nucleic acid-binding protein